MVALFTGICHEHLQYSLFFGAMASSIRWQVNEKKAGRPMESNPVLLIAGVECARGKEKEVNDWYNSTLPQSMMRVPGVVKVDRYERVEDDDRDPAFLSMERLKDGVQPHLPKVLLVTSHFIELLQ